MTAPSIAATLKECLPGILARHPVKLAYLYGSAAAGNATPLSDIDIALVLADGQLEPRELLMFELRVADEIWSACGMGEADVRVINAAPIMFRGEVLTHGILLYSADEEFRVRFETSTRSAYFDFLPVAAQIRQAYFDRLYERGLNG